MPQPRLVKPDPETRFNAIKEAVVESLNEYREQINTDGPIRTVTLEVKLREDGLGVRCVLVSFQGEIQFCVRR